jgi:PadR family transcriptional regulator, regulatory protein PadR
MLRKPKPEIRPTRRVRRVLLVLLTGADELSGYPVSHLAGVNSAWVYVILARLERLGWVASEWQQNPPPRQPGRRRFYRLTRQGRAKAIGLLNLEMPDGG